MSAERDDLPPVLLVHQGTPAEGEAFFARRWPAARAVSDPDLRLYVLFGLHKAGASDMLRPGLWLRTAQALLKGHHSGAPQGDVAQMPGMFLVRAGMILWRHPYRHAGDHPDFDALPAVARAVTAAAR